MSSDERDWVVAPDEARIDIAIGKEAKVSPEVRAALEQLAEAMGAGDDVQGYAFTVTFGKPTIHTGGGMNCPSVQVSDCAVNIRCTGISM